MIPTRQQLEDRRHYGYNIYGYFWSFCKLNRSCEECDKIIRFGCVVKQKIEKLQTKRILCICKPEPPMDNEYEAYQDEMGGVAEAIEMESYNG